MSWNWNAPPGSKPNHRAFARKLLVSFLVGILSIGVAWAGSGLVPLADNAPLFSDANGDALLMGSEAASSGEVVAAGADGVPALQANQVYAGAHKVNIYPDPQKYNGTWEQNQQKCETLPDPNFSDDPEDYPGEIQREAEEEAARVQENVKNAPDYRVRWAENSGCIYTGGFDLGPAHAVRDFDQEYGLWARATAISDGDDTVVLLILDASYYFAKYNNMCNTDPAHKSDFDGDGPDANKYTQDCGFWDLGLSMAQKYGFEPAAPGTLPDQVQSRLPQEIKDGAALAEPIPGKEGDFGITPSSFFLASTHAHAAPDFVGAWGGVPRWYMQQVEDAIRQAVYGAIDSMQRQPAYIEAGEILYRGGSNSRRRHYHAAEEQGLAWMRFVAERQLEPVCTTPAPDPSPSTSPTGKPKGKPSPSPSPTPTPTPTPSCTTPPSEKNVIATVGTYAAHPTNSSNGIAYADIAGVFAKAAEERFGGTGLYFQTGFGNMSSAYSRVQLAKDLAGMLPGIGLGRQVTDPSGVLDVRAAQRRFDNPVTNSALGGGGASGIFDRPMEARPSSVSISKESLGPDAGHMPYKRCNSASPITVSTSVSAARIGPTAGGITITGGPGELFSNYTNTIKEKNTSGFAFPLSLVNDGIGYIMQSFETDHVGRQAVGFVNGPLSEYEDAYSVDACMGDHALEQTLNLLSGL